MCNTRRSSFPPYCFPIHHPFSLPTSSRLLPYVYARQKRAFPYCLPHCLGTRAVGICGVSGDHFSLDGLGVGRTDVDVGLHSGIDWVSV
jgi:hypothetical protein